LLLVLVLCVAGVIVINGLRGSLRALEANNTNLQTQIDALGEQVNSIATEQANGRERGFINRAAACRVQVLLGATLDDTCLDPNVTAHYDPNEPPTAGAGSAGQQRNLRMLCDIEESLGLDRDADCPG
jgi:hypothetical protein